MFCDDGKTNVRLLQLENIRMVTWAKYNVSFRSYLLIISYPQV